MVPTFTTSNERMLLLLADGASGMLRVEDAERLQASCSGGLQQPLAACCMLRGRGMAALCPLPTGDGPRPAAFTCPQGLAVGHTRPCWPIQTPGVGAHRTARLRDADAEAAASKRWDLIGGLLLRVRQLVRRQLLRALHP